MARQRQLIGIWILVAFATLWFLRAASTVLIPIALAVLISYALEPPVAWLERRHVHRMIGSSAVLLLVLGGLTAAAYALRDDATRMIAALPTAAERAREMVISRVGFNADALAQGQTTGSVIERVVSAVFAFAGHLVVIIFLVFFLLISGHHVRSRLVEIMGPAADDRRTVATIIDDINAHIQRYLLVLLFTGTVVAVSTWIVLAWMGVEHAAMWGLLAGIFNSIPYFGPVVVAGGLFGVGIVQGGGISQALQMSAAAIVITSLEGWLLTLPLMGKVERMSALVVFIGLLLWTWVWGAWGTVLAVPMLVIVKSTADHIPRLRPISRLMAP